MERKALIRMAWLCAELHQGNQFSKELYWKWHEEAAEALRHLDKSKDAELFADERQMDFADRTDLKRIGKTALAALAICISLALHAPAQAADEAVIDGPVWIATDTLTCGKYKGVTWSGANGAETFTRFYDVPERDRKNIVLKDDGFYYKGKKCG